MGKNIANSAFLHYNKRKKEKVSKHLPKEKIEIAVKNRNNYVEKINKVNFEQHKEEFTLDLLKTTLFSKQAAIFLDLLTIPNENPNKKQLGFLANNASAHLNNFLSFIENDLEKNNLVDAHWDLSDILFKVSTLAIKNPNLMDSLYSYFLKNTEKAMVLIDEEENITIKNAVSLLQTIVEKNTNTLLDEELTKAKNIIKNLEKWNNQ